MARSEILKVVEATVAGLGELLWTRYPPPRPVVRATPEAMEILWSVKDKDGHPVVKGSDDPHVMGYRIIVSAEDPRSVWGAKIAFVDADAEIIEWSALVVPAQSKTPAPRSSKAPRRQRSFPDIER